MEKKIKGLTDAQATEILEGYLRSNGSLIPLTAKQVELFRKNNFKVPKIPAHMKDAGALLERGMVAYSRKVAEETEDEGSYNANLALAARNGEMPSDESIRIINEALEEED
jgi:hypothetical protein